MEKSDVLVLTCVGVTEYCDLILLYSFLMHFHFFKDFKESNDK